MSEIPFFFSNGSYDLFGISHEPADPGETGFVFVHPFAEEKLWTHRVFVNFARELAQRGFPVLRFDVMGHGDSDGNFEDSTVETRLSDITCAIGQLKEKAPSVKHVGLLGLRFGATLAMLAAEREDNIKKLVLWEPLVNGSKYMQEMLRINLTTQTAVYKEIRYNRDALVEMMKKGDTVNIDGYEVKYELFEQASSINLIEDNPVYKGDCLIVQISKREQKIKKDIEELAAVLNADSIVSIEEPFWKEIKQFYGKAENLFRDTLHWLEKK